MVRMQTGRSACGTADCAPCWGGSCGRGRRARAHAWRGPLAGRRRRRVRLRRGSNGGIKRHERSAAFTPFCKTVLRAGIVCVALDCIPPHFGSIVTTHCLDSHMLALALFQDPQLQDFHCSAPQPFQLLSYFGWHTERKICTPRGLQFLDASSGAHRRPSARARARAARARRRTAASGGAQRRVSASDRTAEAAPQS